MTTFKDIDTINELRLYLRHKYYNTACFDIEKIFGYDTNFISEVKFGEDGESTVTIKLKDVSQPINTASLYNYIDGVLLSLYAANSIDKLIFSDTALSQTEKEKFINLHALFSQHIPLLRYMYMVELLSQRTAIVRL